MKRNNNEDTIVAVSTPLGEGGIGIVRLSGKDSIKIADRVFISSDGRRASRFKSHTIHYGYVVDNERQDTRYEIRDTRYEIRIDEVLLTIMKAPRTYTKEDIVEINCHGGMTAMKKTVELIIRHGARAAEPGEFTKRAFLNGRLDLAQAEAVLDVIRAKTEAALRASVNQLEGSLSREINSLRNNIIGILADVEAGIDFPEEDVETGTAGRLLEKIKAVRKKLEKLAATYSDGTLLKNGITAAICGRTNVGKSSLMNLLLKRDRVIVTPIPGTTRDAIEEMISIKGIPIRLVDTAGIRKRNAVVEKEGIAKSRLYLSNADLILCVLDGSEKLKKDDREILASIKDKCAIIVINKTDLKEALEIREVKRISKNCDVAKISCLDKIGIDRLEDKVYNKIWGGKVHSSSQLILNNARHKDALEKAVCALRKAEDAVRRKLSPEFIAIDIRESIDILGEITGETYTDDILDIIFSKFCIGK